MRCWRENKVTINPSVTRESKRDDNLQRMLKQKTRLTELRLSQGNQLARLIVQLVLHVIGPGI